jgi:transcriptional regulator with XRE-family HTH domain
MAKINMKASADALGDYLREQRTEAKLSLRQLAQATGISNPYLSQIERGLRKPSAEILQQIARALEISSETLYVRAGILEERDGVDLIGEIRRDPFLTEEQKKTLVRIYTSFRHENDPAGGLDAAPAREENAAAESSGTAER